MNHFPKDIGKCLGFEQVRELLISYCQSDRGARQAQKARMLDNHGVLAQLHRQTGEMIRLRGFDNDKISFLFPDIGQYLIKVKVPGTFLDPLDFHQLKIGIRTLAHWMAFFSKRGHDYPCMAGLSSGIRIDATLEDKIGQVIDERGEVKDSASPELLDIRTRIVKSERAVRSAIQKILKTAKADQLTDGDSSLTVREGRLVIPVKAEHKKRIPGFVHDESSTGQTVFLEPGAVLGLNNEVRELKYAERREVVRILTMLSGRVRGNMPDLEKGEGLLEKLDFIFAKTRLAEKFDAIVPKFKKGTAFRLVNAIHPLLYLSHKESGKKIVPLNLAMDHQHRILIISGPNAGGKSVALKTVGLLQYMFQCGLPVPVSEESEFGVFSSLFLDIGDTQSIEDDLSTYSAHLTSMKHFLSFADKKTLFLIDEFGKGTEPQFGGAIAESVLKELNKKQAMGMVTTHYQNLKKMGDEDKGVVNGAMKYDLEALEPLFELEVGKPGSSFAFEIAGKIGLPKPIIETSKKKIGSSHVAYDQLLNRLEKEKSKFEKLTHKLEKEQTDLTRTRKDYEALREMIEVEKKRIIKEAKQEARLILEDANKDVERVIREIQENKAEREKTRQLRKELNVKKTKLKEAPNEKKTAFKPGDTVRVAGQQTIGEIWKVKSKQAEVLFGAIKSIVSIDKLEPAKASKQQEHQRQVKKMGIDLTSKIATFTQEISLLGMRGEEALGKVEAFIDEALLLGVNQVKIVHGKGHGILREIVRNYTKDHPGVAHVEDGHVDRGGAGVSIVTLK